MDPEQRQRLAERWYRLMAQLGVARPAAEGAFNDLVTRYGEPQRHYHNLAHIASVMDAAESLVSGAQNWPAIQLAIWFHDIVYDPHSTENEVQSAQYAVQRLREMGVDGALVGRVEALILATREHRVGPDDRDGQILLDADLATLGAPPAEYTRYAQAIRQEYAAVPDALYRAGRQKLLERFLDRERLFQTDLMYNRLEQAARHNIRRELQALAAPAGE